MTDKMQEEFEKWASGKGLILRKATSGKQFYYLFEDTDYAWQAWQAARTVPEGYVVVPVEPTQKMKGFGAARHGSRLNLCMNDAAMIYEAMLAAAPEISCERSDS